jgi:hypothetical protein
MCDCVMCRGPGDIMSQGTRQSGKFPLSVVAMDALQADPDIVSIAQAAAEQVRLGRDMMGR